MRILGLSCFYHDSAVTCIEDGNILFAIQEERLSRRKHDSRFPIMAINKALEVCGWRINEIDRLVFYENPELKLNRLFDQIIDNWPNSWLMFRKHVPEFYRFKYPIESIIRNILQYKGQIEFCEHHYSHAASTFFTSPFERALVFTIDGVGEYETTVVWIGEGNTLHKVASIQFPDSLGLLYSVFTQYLGFKVNNGEYKVMGLAPYGKPKYLNKLLKKVIHLHSDGSFSLNQRYFNFSNLYCHYNHKFEKLLGGPGRKPSEPINKRHQDIAASIQKVLELAVHNILAKFIKKYKIKDICMAGGVALNCTCNAHMSRELGIRIHVHPAATDAGGSLGAAIGSAIKYIRKNPYRFPFQPYLGTSYSDEQIELTLKINRVAYQRSKNVHAELAEALANGKIVAVLHGRDEWGPRALGNRSILADPRSLKMKDHLNAKIKFREEFRPFAPVIMEEHFSRYFETLGMRNSPYMLFTVKALYPEKIPSAVHIDGTSRVQTVSERQNPYLYGILKHFYSLTGVPVLINTSFNLRGEPIVSSPSDALNTFYLSEIDILAIEDFLIHKSSVMEAINEERQTFDSL